MSLEYKSAEICQILKCEESVPEVVAFDPYLALAILNILTQLIRLYKECGYSESDAIRKAANPGLLGSWRLRSLIKSKLKGTGYEGLYHPVRCAILKSATRSTLTEMQGLFSEVSR